MLKKIFFVFSLIIFLATNLKAENANGYYISHSGDTVKISVKESATLFSKYISVELCQYKIKYFNSSNEKCVLTPEMAREVAFDYEGKHIRMLSRRIKDNDPLFLEIVADGKVKLFKLYKTVYTQYGSYTNEKYYYQKENEPLFKPNSFQFRKEMSAYFSSCPILVEGLMKRIYINEDAEKIVNYYNNKCQ